MPEAAMGRILPTDELGPGAVEAGALYYLDCALTGAEMSLQGLYRSGLRKLKARHDRLDGRVGLIPELGGKTAALIT